MVLNFEFFTWLKCVTLFMMLFLITQAEGKLSLDDNIGIWLLDEGKGDIAKDSSPNKTMVRSQEPSGSRAKSVKHLSSKKGIP